MMAGFDLRIQFAGRLLHLFILLNICVAACSALDFGVCLPPSAVTTLWAYEI